MAGRSNNDGRNQSDNATPFVGAEDPQPPLPLSEEAKIVDRFASLVRTKFSSPDNVKRLDKLYQDETYSTEKKRLSEMNLNGLGKGVILGVATFGFLRMGPKVLTRYLIRRGAGGGVGGGYRFDNAPKVVGAASPFGPGASSTSSGTDRPGFLFRTFRLSLELFVSLTTAAYGSVLFTDHRKLLNDMSEIPLLEGRSLLSDELCDDFDTEYRKLPRSFWEKHEKTTEWRGGDALGAISNFVKNCRRRAAMERRIREEERGGGGEIGTSFGSSDTAEEGGDHPPIPSPGVPRDIDVGVELKGKDEEEEGGDFREDYFMNESDFLIDGAQEKTEDQTLGEWTSFDDFEDEKGGKKGTR